MSCTDPVPSLPTTACLENSNRLWYGCDTSSGLSGEKSLFSHLKNPELCLKVVLLTWNFGSKPNGFYGNPIFSFWLTKIPEKDQQDQWFDKTFTFSNPLSSSTRPKTVRAHLLAANSPCTSRLKMKVCESLKFCWENPLSRLLRPGTNHPLSSCCL